MIILWNYGAKAPNMQSFIGGFSYNWMTGSGVVAPTTKNYYTGAFANRKRMTRGLGW